MIKAEDHILIIFGASGDLTKRKLLPAIYQLFQDKLLPDNFAILGIGRSVYDDNTYQTYIKNSLAEFAQDFNNESDFLKLLHYHSMDPSMEEAYAGLESKLTEIRQERNISDRYIFYLATPPSLYEVIPRSLKKHGLTSQENGMWKRIIVEKPFGLDLESAVDLNAKLLRV
jgi:glucose-6-phosphate 1-dehydrogenase